MYRKLIPYLTKYKYKIAASSLCSVFEAVFELLIPLVLARLLDDGIASGNIPRVLAMGLKMLELAVMIANPSMLLDEAAAGVDTWTENQIELGLDRLMEGKTVFIIAHRLSTVRNADCILVLEHGRILERGTHKELLQKKGRYYDLYTGRSELS